MSLIYTRGLRDMSDRELKSEAQALFESIHNLDCFSAKDVVRQELYCRELERRGYTIDEVKHLVIHK